MERLKLKYRTWLCGTPPRPIKLQIPGWAGAANEHTDGDKPQPWHCIPFVDGSTYGLELIYPFKTEMKVRSEGEEIIFEGDFTGELKEGGAAMNKAFAKFAPGHFGAASCLDLCPPPGHIIRLEPHPKYYTDMTYTTPLVVPGHLQGEWWTKFFFIVFKAPAPGQTYIFRENEPYAQILILPKKCSYEIVEMSAEEKNQRFELDEALAKYGTEIAENRWTDAEGQPFMDVYKVVNRVFAKSGLAGVNRLVQSIALQKDTIKTQKMELARQRLQRRLVLPHYEKTDPEEKNRQAADIHSVESGRQYLS